MSEPGRETLLQLASMLRLARTFGADAPALREAQARLVALEPEPEPLEVLFLADGPRLNGRAVGLTKEQFEVVRQLHSDIEKAGLAGFRLASTQSPLLCAWLAALATDHDALAEESFIAAGLVGLHITTPSPRVEAAAPRSAPEAPPILTEDLQDFASPDPPPAPVPLELLDPTPSRGLPAPKIERSKTVEIEPEAPPIALQDVLQAWVAAADAFETARQHGLQPGNLDQLESAADRLRHVVEVRTDLGLRAHRIQLRGRARVSTAALHAASTAALTTVLCRGLELRGEARGALCLAGLVAHLPIANSGLPVSPSRLSQEQALNACRTLPEGVPSLVWLAAAEHRLNWQRPDGEPRHEAGRVVAVAAGYDAFLRSPEGGASTPEVLKTMAHESTAYDPFFVTVLTAVVAAFR